MIADRPRPNLELERALVGGGYRFIAGIDEAGRGALAGPVVAAAVMFASDQQDAADVLQEVHDSKQLTAKARERAFELIKAHALCWATGSASSEEIDQVGLLPATRLSMTRALASLVPQPDHLLLDYMLLSEDERPQTSQVRADSKSLSVAAASIVAKVTRDQMMHDYEPQHPGYGLGRNKGYGTAEHRQALQRIGPSPIHRRSYQPVATALASHQDG